jgi:hypothetical protein
MAEKNLTSVSYENLVQSLSLKIDEVKQSKEKSQVQEPGLIVNAYAVICNP